MIYSSFVIIGLILATILGTLGQDISYDLNERFPAIELTTAITIVTFISIGLYIIIPISLFIFIKTEKSIPYCECYCMCLNRAPDFYMVIFCLRGCGWVNLTKIFCINGHDC